ncbi:hypothetical protein [Pseudonocardia abyssalis]|nr:hypothetical protein [Pseudonocardia abyssalis]
MTVGETVPPACDPAQVHVFDPDSGRNLGTAAEPVPEAMVAGA